MKEHETKYIYHQNSGLPIRMPPYLRSEIRQGSEKGLIQVDMIRQSPFVDLKPIANCLPENLMENIRLRRVARGISRKLVCYAQEWEVARYCTIVHGSLARGLISSQISADPSDVDVDLVVDSDGISKEKKCDVREQMFKLSSGFGVKVDTYVWDLQEIRRNKGEYARLYLSSAAYPLADISNLWEEILLIGVENQRYLNLGEATRRRFRRGMELIARGEFEEARCCCRGERATKALSHYFSVDTLEAQREAAQLCGLINV